MAKKMKEWEGPLDDLVKFNAHEVSEFWVLRLKGKTFKIDKKTLYDSEGKAKGALRKHLYYNFCQGHYWHKGKDNTFAKEKGWGRNNGYVETSRREFKVFAKDMLEYLLDQDIFTIERIKI